MIEEGQPAFVEDQLAPMHYRAGAEVKLRDEDILPMAAEDTGQVILDAVAGFLRQAAREMPPALARARTAIY